MITKNKIANLSIISILISPLIYSSTTYAGYEFPKVLLFLLALLGLVLRYNFERIVQNRLFMALGFVLILVLTAAQGLNFKNSLFSSPLRNTGILFYLFLIVWILILSEIIIFWELIFLTISICGFLVSILGIMEGGPRPISTIGNPSEAAAYVLLAFWASICFVFLSKSKYRYLILLSIISNVIYIYETKTRSAFIALLVSILLVFLYYGIRKLSSKVLILGVLVIILIMTWSYYNLDFFNLGRSDSDFNDRIGFFNISKSAFINNPFLGYGLGNFLDLSYRYYDGNLVTNNSKLDKSHSIFYEYLLGGGIVLIGYMAYLFIRILKNVLKHKIETQIAVFGAFLSYFIWGFFSIDNYSCLLVLAVFIAFSISHKNESLSHLNKNTANFFKLFLTFTLVSYAFILGGTVFRLNNLRNTENPEEAKLILNSKYLNFYPDSAIEESVLKSEAIPDTITKYAFIRVILDKNEFGNPQNSHILNIKAKLLADIGNFSKAQLQLKRSISLNPNFAYTFKQLGVLYLQQNQAQNAFDIFEYICNKYPLDITAKIQKAAILGLYLKDPTGAFKILKALKNSDKSKNFETLSSIFIALNVPVLTGDFYAQLVDVFPYLEPFKYKIILNHFLESKDTKNYSITCSLAGKYLLSESKYNEFKALFLQDNINYRFSDIDAIINFLGSKQTLF